MKTPQIPALPGMTPLGLKPYAQVIADRPLKPAAEQKPCDVGLFGDTMSQADLIDLLRK